MRDGDGWASGLAGGGGGGGVATLLPTVGEAASAGALGLAEATSTRPRRGSTFMPIRPARGTDGCFRRAGAPGYIADGCQPLRADRVAGLNGPMRADEVGHAQSTWRR